MGLLDPKNIDATRVLWQEKMVEVVQQYHGLSQARAVAYLNRYRVADIGTLSGPLVRPGVDVAATRGMLDATGPQAFKKLVGEGVPEYVAFQRMSEQVAVAARREIMAGGRGVVRESTREDPRAIGWRRVAAPDSCSFCAMLVTRGPAYTSMARALAKGNGDPYHYRCGCTVEPVYSDWVPNEVEQLWIDAYFDVAEQVSAEGLPRAAGTILPRLRASGKFTDSPAVRAK